MRIQSFHIDQYNAITIKVHENNYRITKELLAQKSIDADAVVEKLRQFQIAIPSWALGAGGTRFGRFSTGGEPGNLEQKLDDIGLLHALTRSAGAISLHIPWDIPRDAQAIKQQASELDIVFDAMNSNTFQDQKDQALGYKFGSLSHINADVRKQAVEHNIEVISYGQALGSKSITVWLADGSSFPGQLNFRRALDNTLRSLQEIYAQLPADWQLFIEYKPYEPYFYSTVIQDWGTSFLLANELGNKAYTLVDLGHHLPNTNIEQIVSTLMYRGKLGGFHFNDSKYGDDDLTVGSIKPYQLYLIFNELVYGLENNTAQNPSPAWMIDASHNLKDPLEDLIQSLEAIRLAYAQALIVDRQGLWDAQLNNDVSVGQEILQDAFRTDVRPLLQEARLRSGGVIEPIKAYRYLNIRQQLIKERGSVTVATGL
ncbi:sugar isomerase [Cytophagaceae bacterium DM2B3-1]|uniref:Sugar isomerase n=1 Tax=Xanthocytophaga flava TaxID=3048013 RepID=A0ABT7CRU3_9BACT|nr:sugar isomerase [Xanthocytophaga flavus]MDJ1495682.1 sugar isomerase [Xanthocytophaga flavus]